MNGSSLFFRPGVVSYLFGPFHHARVPLWRFVARVGSGWAGRMLDVGCGGRPYIPLFAPGLEQVGLDIDQERNRARGLADVFYDGTSFPFDDGSFDSVLCSQVLEHVFSPEQFVEEIARVLRPGGDLLLTVPFFWAEHEAPWDAMRYTSHGVKALLERHGFEIMQQDKSVTGFQVLLQIAQARVDQFLWRRLRRRSSRIAARLVLAPFHLAMNIAGSLLAILPSFDEDIYLDNLVHARRVK